MLQRFDRQYSLAYRGHIRVKDDKDVTPADFAKYNVVLFGDPGSNRWIAKLQGKLPLHWTKETVALGTRRVPRVRIGPGADLSEPAESGTLCRDQQRTDRRLGRLGRRLPDAPLWRLRDLQSQRSVRTIPTPRTRACSTNPGSYNRAISENFGKSTRRFQLLTAEPRRSPKSACYSPDEKSCSVAEKQPFRGRVPIQSSRDTRSGPNAGATFPGRHCGLYSTSSGAKEISLQSRLARVDNDREFESILSAKHGRSDVFMAISRASNSRADRRHAYAYTPETSALPAAASTADRRPAYPAA